MDDKHYIALFTTSLACKLVDKLVDKKRKKDCNRLFTCNLSQPPNPRPERLRGSYSSPVATGLSSYETQSLQLLIPPRTPMLGRFRNKKMGGLGQRGGNASEDMLTPICNDLPWLRLGGLREQEARERRG